MTLASAIPQQSSHDFILTHFSCEPEFMGSNPEAILKPPEHLAAVLLTDQPSV